MTTDTTPTALLKYKPTDEYKKNHLIATGKHLPIDVYGWLTIDVPLEDLTPDQRKFILKITESNPDAITLTARMPGAITGNVEDYRNGSIYRTVTTETLFGHALTIEEWFTNATKGIVAHENYAKYLDKLSTTEATAVFTAKIAEIKRLTELSIVSDVPATGREAWYISMPRSEILGKFAPELCDLYWATRLAYMTFCEAEHAAAKEIERERNAQQEAEKAARRNAWDADMKTWIAAHGSKRLQTAIEAGYEAQMLYIIERARSEFRAFDSKTHIVTVDTEKKADTNDRNNPTTLGLNALKALQTAYPAYNTTLRWMTTFPLENALSGRGNDAWTEQDVWENKNVDYEGEEVLVVEQYLGKFDVFIFIH